MQPVTGFTPDAMLPKVAAKEKQADKQLLVKFQVDHMTKLMLDGGREEPEDKENRKENRRETWAPGLAGDASSQLVFTD